MIVDVSNPKFIKTLIKTPEKAIDKLDLVYINDDKLTIRRHRKGKGFIYKLNGKKLSTQNDLKRIKSLVIPPAWENVRIAALDNGHLQATGRDLKNRKQYRYHPLWQAIRNQTKFYKMADFAEQLPKIRKQVDKDLDKTNWSKNKVLALIIRLMEETHIRIGNEQYAKRNKTYGLSTLRTRHVNIEKDRLKFEFIGKRGKKHSVTLKNQKLIKLVNRCEEIPGWELFQYYDDTGNKHSIESSMVNEYLHTIGGELFTAKDFRTWGATKIAFEKLREVGTAKEEKNIHKNILLAYDAAAEGLGNTRNVCRKYYVHPAVIKNYQDGSIQDYFDKLEISDVNGEYFSNTEHIILKLLKNYTPPFLIENNLN